MRWFTMASRRCFLIQVALCVVFVLGMWWHTSQSVLHPPQRKLHKLVKKVFKTLPILNIQRINAPWKPHSGSYAGYLDIPEPRVQGVNCRGLILGKEDSEKYIDKKSSLWNPPDEYYIKASSVCPSLIETRKYIMRPVNVEEAAYPLAFSLVVYKNVHQVEQLLRAIYRPQNYYCIHVDANANHIVYQALSNIARCFKNVIMSSQRYAVRWGEYSVLQPEFTCMADMWNKTDWKYFINLTGQEFPLKTMLDIVQILKTFNGSNAIGIDHRNNRPFRRRVQYHYKRVNQHGPAKEPAPNNMKLAFGPVHVALTRSYVNFVLHHRIAQQFKQWVRDTNFPDETFFGSLNVNPGLGVPGAYTGDTHKSWDELNPFTRYKKWFRCKKGGRLTRGICILGVNDLWDLAKAQDMFANKFFSEHQPVGRMCLEELIFNRTRGQIRGGSQLQLDPYKKPLFVKQHAPS